MVSSGSNSNQKALNNLVDNLVSQGVITNQKIASVMKTVDRFDYMPKGSNAQVAYADSPHRIGCNVTISAPHMHAYCLDWCV